MRVEMVVLVRGDLRCCRMVFSERDADCKVDLRWSSASVSDRGANGFAEANFELIC